MFEFPLSPAMCALCSLLTSLNEQNLHVPNQELYGPLFLYLHLVYLHMLLCKWLDINRMCQVHLYPPPFIQIFIRKNTRCQRLDRYFCTLRQLTCKLVQTFARMSLEIYLSSSLFPCWPPSNSSSTFYVHPILLYICTSFLPIYKEVFFIQPFEI